MIIAPARIVFLNPNEPEQPSKGVYRWFYRDLDKEITIYVGCAGNRRETVGAPSTLKRGIQEAQRSCVTSDKGKQLDTDFVVGTTLRYLKQKGHDCVWQHLSDDPRDERKLCAQYGPLLQSARSTIHRHFRLAKPGGELWLRTDVGLAETHLLQALGEFLVPSLDEDQALPHRLEADDGGEHAVSGDQCLRYPA